MQPKLGGWVLSMLGLCISLWLVWNGSRKDPYEISLHVFPNGYVSEFNRVNDTSVKPDIRCMGAGPDEAEDLFCMLWNPVPKRTGLQAIELHERPRYLSAFKNPCWYAKEDGKLRLKCIPYFHILGVVKSGTTDLDYRIRAHEDVLLKQKEIHYWCLRRYEISDHFAMSEELKPAPQTA